MLSTESDASSRQDSKTEKLKIIFIGDDKTGRSEIFANLLATENTESKGAITSISKNLDGTLYEFWNFLNSDNLKSKKELYYTDADAAIAVFNRQDTESFTSIPCWISEMIKFKKMLPLVIIGNSVGKAENVVNKEEVLEFVYNLGDCSACKIPYIETTSPEKLNYSEILKNLLLIIECDKKDKCFDKVSQLRKLCDLQQFYDY
jgi:GTPase SAR1 family protein